MNVPPPTTVLAVWEGVEVLRGQDSTWIVCYPCYDPDCFDEAIRLLGFAGRDDYEVLYDPGTGRETFIFDGDSEEPKRPQVQGPVRTMRDQDISRVLSRLPSGRPEDDSRRQVSQGTRGDPQG